MNRLGLGLLLVAFWATVAVSCTDPLAPETHAVLYDGNEADSGTVPVDTGRYAAGAQVTVLDNTGNLAKAGLFFSGWNTAADGSGTALAPGAAVAMGNTDLTLYAVWTTEQSYMVSYHANGAGSGTVPLDPTLYTAGQTATVLANTGNLAKEGFSFNGWNTAADGTGTAYAPGASLTIAGKHILLYAQWTSDSQPTGVADVEAYYWSSYFLKEDGSLWACGDNGGGHLGDGSNVDRTTPVQVASDVRQVSVSSGHAMIVKTDGSLWAAGYNTDGQLGDGTKVNRYSWVQVMASGVASVAAGNSHTMIVKTDGSLWATGSNLLGELADGTNTARTTPVQVMDGVARVTAGVNATWIVKTDGSLWAVGQNSDGQLGDGSTIDRTSPVQIMTDVASVVEYDDSCLILKTDGSLWGTGVNNGKLGDGTMTRRLAPIQVATRVVDMDLGDTHSLILKDDGTLWGAGYNSHNQLGLDQASATFYLRFGLVATDVAKFACGEGYSVFLKTDGSFWTIGWNIAGQIGDGTETERNTLVGLFGATADATRHGVRYDANGATGTVPVDSASYACGEAVTVLPKPESLSRSGAGFAGWNLNAQGTGSMLLSGTTIPMGAEDLVLYAIWDTGTGQMLSDNDTLEFPGGSRLKLVSTPAVSRNPVPHFPTGLSDAGEEAVPPRFAMASTETTYGLWAEVREWAASHGYLFANYGLEGSDGVDSAPPGAASQEPVTVITWRDAVVWCNALTEYYNAHNGALADLRPVYYTDDLYTTPLRESLSGVLPQSNGNCDVPYIQAAETGNTDVAQCTADGFRLPGNLEWEYAARYRGADSTNAILMDGVYYTKGNSMSGASAAYSNASASDAVAWLGQSKTQAVAQKQANQLGLYDMSGNVAEFCDEHWDSIKRPLRGGAYNEANSFKQISAGLSYSGLYQGCVTYAKFKGLGFRVARNVAAGVPEEVPVSGVSLDTAEATLEVDGTRNLRAIVSPVNASDQSLVWTSSDSLVATVAETSPGLATVTARAAGTARIRATAVDGGLYAECTVTVSAPVADFDLTGEWVYVVHWNNGAADSSTWVCQSDKTWQTPSNSYHGTWAATGNTVVITYSSGTVFTGTVSGTGISGQALSYSGSTGPFTAVPKASAISVTGVSLASTATVSVGDSLELTAEVSPANATNNLINWSTSDSAICQINATNGLTVVLTGAAVGSAVVTATTKNGGHVAACTVTVTAADYVTGDRSTNAVDLRGQNGVRVTYRFPDGLEPSASIWGGGLDGTGYFTDDTKIYSAAVYAGVLVAGSGGDVVIEIATGQASYTGGTRNGVTSRPYGSWSGSYRIIINP